MADYPTSFDKEGLLKCARGELFGPGNAQLPAPPMLMMDRITDVSADGGAHGKGSYYRRIRHHARPVVLLTATSPATRSCRAALALTVCGSLPVSTWAGAAGRGAVYALGVGEVKLTGMVRPDRKMLTYKIDFTKAIQTRRLTMGVADGIVEADGEVIYMVKDMKVALSES